jgi:hypothetical protein
MLLQAKASKPPSKKQGGGEQPEPKTYAVKRTAEETFAEDRHVELERHKLAKQGGHHLVMKAAIVITLTSARVIMTQL